MRVWTVDSLESQSGELVLFGNGKPLEIFEKLVITVMKFICSKVEKWNE